MLTNGVLKDQWYPILSEMFELSEISDVTMITQGGSSREFYRIRCGGESCILLEHREKHEGLADYVEIGTFYASRGVSVPRIMLDASPSGLVLLEDLGDISLYSSVLPLVKGGKESEITDMYRKVIDELLKLQALPPREAPYAIRSRRFNRAYYRYESDYFREKCCELRFGREGILEDSSLSAELDSLAQALELLPSLIVHRDFQSQNICMKNDSVYFIDFQSARLGSMFYDLASLLKDPYVELPRHIQDQLLEYYLTEQRKYHIWPGLSRQRGRTLYHLVGLQRLMQALGAYGKLGIDDGKSVFLGYIPSALRLLEDTLKETTSFPCLASLVSGLCVEAG